MEEDNILTALVNMHTEDEEESSEQVSFADLGHDDDDNDSGDNPNMAAQAATHEVLIGIASDNITADKKSESDAGAKAPLNNDTKSAGASVNSAEDKVVVEGGKEDSKKLLHGPAISSLQVPPQQEIDEDTNPSRSAMGIGSTTRNKDALRRSSSADNLDQVPTAGLRGQQQKAKPADAQRADRLAQRTRNKERAAAQERQQLADRVQRRLEEEAYARKCDDDARQQEDDAL
jgi:hypothetical protein